MVFFVMGMLTMGYAVAALFFLRFWRETGDRLFALFAAAFAVLALTRFLLALTGRPTEPETLLYWGRFFAFLLILLAILDKNRPRRGKSETEQVAD